MRFIRVASVALWLTIVAVLSLAGCAEIPAILAAAVPTVATVSVPTLEAAYMTASATELDYEGLPACGSTQALPCQTPAGVTQLKTLDDVAFGALSTVEAETETPTATEAAAATAGIAALTDYLTSQGLILGATN